MIRVLVVDDEPEARDSIAVILGAEEDLEVVAVASDGAEAIERNRELRPDVVVMDLRMPGMDGVTATAELVRDPRHAPAVLALTTFASDDLALQAIRAGAAGFSCKGDSPDALAQAVRTVSGGDAIVSPGVLRGLLDRLVGPVTAPPADCSPRELEVLAVVAEGATNGEIADRLYISETTVRTHVQHLRSKLGARSRAELVVRAQELGVGPYRSPRRAG